MEFEVLEIGTDEEALRVVARGEPDLALIHVAFSTVDGVEVLRRLRRVSAMPVIAFSESSELADKIAALDAGADDYITIPFETEEVVARGRALFRRVVKRAPIRVGDLTIDVSRRQVAYAGERVWLTPIELNLLQVLIANHGNLLTHEDLFDTVWGSRPARGRERLRVTIHHLRQKLHDDVGDPKFILNEPGLGYRWIAGNERFQDE